MPVSSFLLFWVLLVVVPSVVVADWLPTASRFHDWREPARVFAVATVSRPVPLLPLR